ncbi:hypothetical protein [Natronosalvus rutilus]|uniref:Uncharacterized protein n=1 Tax=Natronosalvus rutilus TaxID=2953753 RepID=A0A9E7NAI6_9EURY|nr:hypothetical protein [Natronosalvus rutilus]UTF53479.1 hypothetical protein NGM29_17180 [Natronosalvus rutilus]
MDVPVQHDSESTLERSDSADTDCLVTCHETRPGKAVFTEWNNTDAWIATDLTVDLEP